MEEDTVATISKADAASVVRLGEQFSPLMYKMTDSDGTADAAMI